MAGEKQKSPTEELIDQCIEQLEDQRKAKQAEKKALETACKLKECVEDYKVCCLEKSQDVWVTYNQLDLCYTSKSTMAVELLNGHINKYCDKEKELEQKLKEAVKCIGETKKKLNEVVNEACKLDRCVKEEKRCKNGLYDQIKGAKNEWKSLIKEIEAHSVECFNRACNTFDKGVDVVGIQTFVDIESLKVLGSDLQKYTLELQSDIESNIQKSYDQWSKDRAELVTIQKELVQEQFAKCDADNCKDAIRETLEFLCDPNAYLCAKVKDNFGKDVMDDCDDDEEHKKPNPKKKQKSQDDDEDWDID